jgi:hypothetical protein
MANPLVSVDPLRAFLEDERIATLAQLKEALGTTGTMTVFRKLKTVGYRTSYSHRGKYYTLPEMPDFDTQGLWSWHSVWFSSYGNLVETVRAFVDQADSGFTASELESVLHVECKRALLKLYRDQRLARARIGGVYVYLARHRDTQRQQKGRRQEHTASADIAPQVEALSHELRAAIVLFFSLLDERQRRLYAGLEAQKFGHGGDRKIAELLGLDVHTVAKGRGELFAGDVDPERVRRQGGGRKTAEKKRRTSSRRSSG